MREYLRRLLAQRYRVYAVANGEEAVKAARELNADLVLTDVMMPVLDGFGVLRTLRSDPEMKFKPIILLSARAGEESRVEGLERERTIIWLNHSQPANCLRESVLI
jgi:CheY-like chemotaxis protein